MTTHTVRNSHVLEMLRVGSTQYGADIYIYIGTHAPDRKIYLSAKSRVLMSEQVDISTPFDLVANGIRAMPSGAGKRQCRVSVLSACICLTRIIDQLL